MRIQIVILVLLGGALSGCATPRSADQPKEYVLMNLLEQPLAEEFAPGREVVISYVELPPNMTMERHWHPGEEFQYYLDGEVEITIDGEPSIIGTPGTVGHVPFKKMHTAITRESGAKVLVFRVHTLGEPVRFLEGGGSSEQ